MPALICKILSARRVICRRRRLAAEALIERFRCHRLLYAIADAAAAAALLIPPTPPGDRHTFMPRSLIHRHAIILRWEISFGYLLRRYTLPSMVTLSPLCKYRYDALGPIFAVSAYFTLYAPVAPLLIATLTYVHFVRWSPHAPMRSAPPQQPIIDAHASTRPLGARCMTCLVRRPCQASACH